LGRQLTRLGPPTHQTWAADSPDPDVASLSLRGIKMSDSEEEELGIIEWLFDVLFGRTSATEEAVGDAIHRLGDMKQRRARERD
jgi:hypothetical protein